MQDQQAEQRPHALNELALHQPEIGEANARAIALRRVPDTIQGGFALIDQHFEVTVVLQREGGIHQPPAIIHHVASRLDLLSHERRLVLFQRRLVAHELGVEPGGRDAEGDHLDRLEHREAHRRQILFLSRCGTIHERREEGFPAPHGDGAQPAPVIAFPEREGKDVFERIAVERGRQDAEGELLCELTPESFLGLDAGVRTEVHRPLRRNEVKEMRAQPVREIGFLVRRAVSASTRATASWCGPAPSGRSALTSATRGEGSPSRGSAAIASSVACMTGYMVHDCNRAVGSRNAISR